MKHIELLLTSGTTCVLQLLLYRDFRPRDKAAFEAQHSVAGQNLIAPAETVVTKRASVGATTTGVPFTGQLYWLWSFESSITSGRNVSCMVWNKVRFFAVFLICVSGLCATDCTASLSFGTGEQGPVGCRLWPI